VVINGGGSVTSETATLTIQMRDGVFISGPMTRSPRRADRVFRRGRGGGLAYKWYVKKPAGDWSALSSD
jgi:hypothetical protein